MGYVDTFGDRLLKFLKVPYMDILRVKDDGTYDETDPYLRRFYIYRGKYRPHVYLHHIIRSDYEKAMHDHPWGFLSIIVKGGYWEHIPSGTDDNGEFTSARKWHGPGSVLRRFPHSVHRLELPADKLAWSLVVSGEKVRDWGFWIKAAKWCSFRKYDMAQGRCED